MCFGRQIFVQFAACLLIALKVSAFQAAEPTGDSSVVILLYHRFGEDSLPTTNIRIEQFESQIAELASGGYNVMRLSDAVQHLKEKKPFPPKSVVITVDDAYRSVFEEGWPRLRDAGLPFTLFVSSEPVDQKNPNYMSWDDIRTLQSEGVEIGHHTDTHLHMIEAGSEAALADVAAATARFEQELGATPPLFAYPYGEYIPALRDAVMRAGFQAAFAQHSGPASFWDDLYALPRFPVNERFGNMARFKLIIGSKAIPVEDVSPKSPLVNEAKNPPIFGFTGAEGAQSTAGLACYPSHTGEPAQILRPAPGRVEIRFAEPLPKGRNRINCTVPPGSDRRWSWFSRFFYVPGGTLD